MDQQPLFESFVDTTLPADQFHHQQHVQVAWLFVRKYGMPGALGEFAAAISGLPMPRAQQGCITRPSRGHFC